MRHFLGLGLLLIFTSISLAADAPKPTGNWRFKVGFEDDKTFLLAFSEEDGKWVADLLGVAPPFADARQQPLPAKLLKVTAMTVKGDQVAFAMSMQGTEILNFEGTLAKDGKKIVGNFNKVGKILQVAELVSTKLKSINDPVEIAREDFANLEPGQELFEAGFLLASNAAEKKLKPEEARAIADKLTKTAAPYGPRWERHVATRLADAFIGQTGFAEIGLAQAQRLERMLGDTATLSAQLQVQSLLVRALTQTGQAEEAKKLSTNLAKLEARDAVEYVKTSLTFETPEFKGRKAKSDRVALMEVFTGSELEACAAVDVACDGLLKAYKPSELTLLRYHLHVSAPDALCNNGSLERGMALFGRNLGAPRVLIDGKPQAKLGGGTIKDAKDKYKDLTSALDEELEKPGKAKIALTVAKDDKGLKVTAKVSDVEKPGEKMTLRFAVIEPKVRFDGASGVRYHANVVRAVPGGAAGFPVAKKDLEQSVVVNAEEIRKELIAHLDDFSKQAEFPRSDRPMALKNLKIIAFVQDDATLEVLNAVQIDLEAK